MTEYLLKKGGSFQTSTVDTQMAQTSSWPKKSEGQQFLADDTHEIGIMSWVEENERQNEVENISWG